MSTDIAERLVALRRDAGPVATVPDDIVERDTTLVASPAGVRHVLETNQDTYRKAPGYREELRAVFGHGLLTSEDDLWARQHRVVRPLFTSRNVRSYAGVVTTETDRLLERWDSRASTGDPIDLLEEMERLTLLIIGRVLFSTDVDDHAEDIGSALEALRRAFRQRTDPRTSADAEVVQAAARGHVTLDSIVTDIVETRRAEGGERGDLVDRLLAAAGDFEEDPGSFVRDQVITFLLAGHETTAAALTWTWLLLADHPEHHERLHGRARVLEPTGDLEGFAPFERAVREAMRLYPPVPMFTREAIADDDIAGHRVPAGSQVMLSQYVVHRDPALWADPLAYRPSRFEVSDRPRYSYFPFGGGPRMCIGREFALLEAQLVLARALERFKLTVTSPDPAAAVGVNSAVTLVPSEPIVATLERW